MVIAFANHKGGTGKTTTVVNIGYLLAKKNLRVLLVDLDPQGNLSYSFGLNEPYDIGDWLIGEQPFERVACETNGLHILPGSGRLYAGAESLANLPESKLVLKSKLASIKGNYDFILLDCPPSISIYTLNALNAADGVVIPLLLEILSVQGLDQVIDQIFTIQQSSNPKLTVIGAMGTIVNESRKLTEEILEYIRDNYNINIFNNYVHNSVKAAEAPSFALPVVEYAPTASSSIDYNAVTNELLRILKK